MSHAWLTPKYPIWIPVILQLQQSGVVGAPECLLPVGFRGIRLVDVCSRVGREFAQRHHVDFAQLRGYGHFGGFVEVWPNAWEDWVELLEGNGLSGPVYLPM